MFNDLLRTFNVLDGLYASIQEACDIHHITQDGVIPENLEGLFNYLSREVRQEIETAINFTLKIKSEQLSLTETEQVHKGLETITNLFNDYDWLFTKTNAINGIEIGKNSSLSCFSGLFKQ